MFNSVRKKIFLTISLLVCCVLSISGITLFFNRNSKPLIASSNGFTLTVGNDEYSNGDVIMLSSATSADKLKVSFKPEYQGTIIDMRESLTINGQPVDTEMTIGSTVTDGASYSFDQEFYYTKTLRKLNNAEITNETLSGIGLQGEYTYTFEYTGESRYVNTITFYVIFDVDYYAGDDKSNNAPILKNTSKIDRYYKKDGNTLFSFSDKTEANFYNFNKTDYPTYSYDASKYNLSWEYMYNGLVSTYTTQFKKESEKADAAYKVYVYKDEDTTPVQEYSVTTIGREETSTEDTTSTNPLSDAYMVNLQFDQVGEYTFNILPVVKTQNGYETMLEDGCLKLKDENHQIAKMGDVTLNVFGYQLFYTNYGKTPSDSILEFKGVYAKNQTISTNLINTSQLIKTETDTSTNTTNIKLTKDGIEALNKVSTNQAPVTFGKYNVTMSQKNNKSNSFAYYFAQANSKAIEIEVTSSTKFSNNGYYIVYTEYTYSKNLKVEENGRPVSDPSAFRQWFGFRINNGEPNINMEIPDVTTSATKPFYANQITNQNVTISWNENSIFDNPSVYEVYYTYNKTSEYHTANEGNDGQYTKDPTLNLITIKAQPNRIIYWKVVIKYGPTNNTSLAYNFTTDTTPITSTVVGVTKSEKFVKGSELANEETPFVSTNSYFYVDYTSQKDSGATITSSYYYIPLEKDTAFSEYTTANTNNFEYIYNGYKLGTDASKYSYAHTEVVDNEISGANANNVLSNAGLYLFKFEDSAGNINYKFVFVENTPSLLLINTNPTFSPEDTTTENNTTNNKPIEINVNDQYIVLTANNSIYLQSVNIVWGSNKAIDVSNIKTIKETLKDFLKNYSNDIITDLKESKYIVFQNSATIEAQNASGEQKDSNMSDLTCNDKIVGKTLKLKKQTDEANYVVNIISNNNKSPQKTLKMSTDNSQVTAYHYNETPEKFNLDKNQLEELNSTSDKFLYLTWINNSGDYEIDSLVAQFYPLTYDITSKLYPYGENSTSTTNLLADADEYQDPNNANNKNKTYALHTPFETQGMYVVTRTYKNALPSGSIDMSTRTYIYFVDRNKIFDSIKLSDNKTFNIGETISLLVGSKIENDNDYQKVLTSNDFAQAGSNATLFKTNKLPVTLQVTDFSTLNKYSQLAKITNASKTGLTIGNIHPSNFNYAKNSWISKIQSAFKLKISINDVDIDNNLDSSNTELIKQLIEDSNYNILISETNSSANNINHSLKFEIESVIPNGEFITITGTDYNESSTNYNKYTILDTTPALNSIDNTLFAWSDPTDEYYARIDKNNIKISIFRTPEDNKGTTATFEIKQSNIQGFDYIINLSKVVADFRIANNVSNTTDLFVKIHLQYLGYQTNSTNHDEYIFFDFTAPDVNYNKLINNDNFLTQEKKETFSNYNSSVNFDNYAFNIDKSFNFTADDSTIGNTQIKSNTTKVFFRQYNKYEEISSGQDIENLQSLISSDDRYNQNDRYPRLRFATYLTNIYTELPFNSNANINFYNYLVSRNFAPYGYFEIIEIDMAGNERIYSVYLPKEKDNITFEIEDGSKSDIQTISTELNYSHEVNSYLFNLTNITLSNKEWLVLNVIKDNTLVESYKISPISSISNYISISNAIDIINAFAKNVDTEKGTSYKFEFTKQLISNDNTTVTSSHSIVYNYPSKAIELTLTEGISGNSKILYVSWTESLSTQIKEFIASSQNKNSVFEKLDISIVSNTINPFSKYIVIDITNGGSFMFEYKDNFNRSKTVNYIVGIENLAEIEYSKNIITNENIAFTAGQVYVKYQPLTYKVKITPLDDNYKPMTENGQEISLDLSQFNSYTMNTLTYIPLFDLTKSEIKGYKVTISNSLAQENEVDQTYNVVYMPLLGKLSIKDNTSREIFNDESIGVNVTSESCYIYIDNSSVPSIIPTFVSGIYTNENGDVVDLGIIDAGSCLSNVNVGKYELTIYNELGTSKKITFEIRSSISKDYSIITKTTKQLLVASSVKYSYGANNIDWFFTTEDYDISLSSIRYTKYAIVGTPINNDGDITTIYLLNNNNDKLSSAYKEKYIAITKMNNNYNFINSANNSLLIDNSVVTGAQYQSSNQNFTLKLALPYYKFEGNLISIYYSYNDSDLTLINSTNISFSNAGIYKFYFVDHAGNKQIFNNLDYYKVMLFNEVIINVNNSQKIDNAVFNGSVVISIVEPNIYKSNSFTISVIKNNSQSVSVSKINNTYSFSDYGSYKVTITAELAQNSRQVQTVYNFVILNPNESYVTYEYIAPSNYEVTKIEKDGEDVTEQIRQELSKQLYEDEESSLSTITSLTLSGLTNGIGGNGRYTITVLARNINNNIDKSFSFNVWINAGEEAYILSSISAGSASTKQIRLKVNTNQIYKEIGTCNITINNTLWLSIDAQGVVTNHLADSSAIVLVEASSSTVAYNTYKIVATGTYNIKIQSTNGNTLMSFTVTKNEPLNSTAILVIVLSIVAVIAFVTVFLLLRKKMRVK